MPYSACYHYPRAYRLTILAFHFLQTIEFKPLISQLVINYIIPELQLLYGVQAVETVEASGHQSMPLVLICLGPSWLHLHNPCSMHFCYSVHCISVHLTGKCT